MLADARRALSLADGIRGYLRADLGDEALARRLERDLATRGERLVALLRQTVFSHPTSPYGVLLDHAGVEEGDLVALVADEGVEGALERLRDVGVHVTPEELKGRTPIRRGSLSFDVGPGAFDNPLAGLGIETLSGGSSGRPTAVGLALDDLTEDIAYVRPWVRGAGLLGSPLLLWRSAPPFRSGLRNAVRSLRSGVVLDRWWSPAPVGLRGAGLRDAAALAVARAVVRASGERLPAPVHLPLDRPGPIADALARLAAEGRRPLLDATAGAAVRVARAALDAGFSLEGGTVRTGGEPLSPGKVAVLRAAGLRPACHYQAHEIGRIGVACGDAIADDDVHVASGRLAVIPGEEVGDATRLLFTGIATTPQRVLLNADIGDAAVIERRACGCPLGEAGLHVHLHAIQPVAKLTSDGTNILHVELVELVERTLPARFGGGPGDYQLVETEEEGLPRVHVVVSPRLGAVHDEDVVDAVLEAVGAGPRWRRTTAGVWSDGQTVRVVRREPSPTPSGKLPAFRRMA